MFNFGSNFCSEFVRRFLTEVLTYTVDSKWFINSSLSVYIFVTTDTLYTLTVYSLSF